MSSEIKSEKTIVSETASELEGPREVVLKPSTSIKEEDYDHTPMEILGHIRDILNDENYEPRLSEQIKEEARLLFLNTSSRIKFMKKGFS